MHAYPCARVTRFKVSGNSVSSFIGPSGILASVAVPFSPCLILWCLCKRKLYKGRNVAIEDATAKLKGPSDCHSGLLFKNIHPTVHVLYQGLKERSLGLIQYIRVVFVDDLPSFTLAHFFALFLPAPIPLANLPKFPNELRLLCPAWAAAPDDATPDPPPPTVPP